MTFLSGFCIRKATPVSFDDKTRLDRPNPKRLLPGRKNEPKRVIAAEVDGGGFYYYPEDLEEVQSSTPLRSSRHRPIPGAVKRHADGSPHPAHKSCKCVAAFLKKPFKKEKEP
jgi:hypothetical protein